MKIPDICFVCLYRSRSVALLLSFIFFSAPVFSQFNTNELGGWTMFTSQIRLHDKLSLHAETQFRSYDVQPNTEQVFLRGGINFHYSPTVIFTAGYGWFTNFKNDGDIFKSQISEEHRVWQQMILKSSSGRFFFEHRYRLEQRWIESAGKISYKNRIRYLFRVTIPINNKEIKKNTLFVGLYDEIFIHFNNAPFDRNRLFGALGFQLSSSTNIQAGYLLQTVGTQSKQYLQLGINFNPDLRKPKQ